MIIYINILTGEWGDSKCQGAKISDGVLRLLVKDVIQILEKKNPQVGETNEFKFLIWSLHKESCSTYDDESFWPFMFTHKTGTEKF